MSRAHADHPVTGSFYEDFRPYFGGTDPPLNSLVSTTARNICTNVSHVNTDCSSRDFSRTSMEHGNYCDYAKFGNFSCDYPKSQNFSSLKRRRFSGCSWENSGRPYNSRHGLNNSFLPQAMRSDANASVSSNCKRDRSKFEDESVLFMSRDEIERCSPSRKDGIDVVHETHLRYSYCAFLQNLGLRLELPQTTIGTAMVLCHRFFVRRSHACHDRFLIATAALFLATKSEEMPCPLNNALKTSSEIFYKQDFSSLYYVLHPNWFEQYRERVIDAEQMILTTLNFELEVQHPYAPLTSILDKLGLVQSLLVNLALSLVSEGACRRIANALLYDILFGGLICC